MAHRVLDFDWSQTVLGPRSSWPQSLRTAVQMVLSMPSPNIVLWGPDLIQIYNDGYRDLMNGKHPTGLGQPTRECWPEVWHINEPIYRRVLNGASLSFEDALFPIIRFGTLVDAWFTLSYSPIRDESEAIVGILVSVMETTAKIKAEGLTQSLVAHLPGAAVFVVAPDHPGPNADLRYRLAEGEALRAAGFAPADFVGRTLIEAVRPELVAEYEPQFRRALEQGKSFVHEHDSYGRSFVTHGTPIFERSSGRAEAVLAVSYDITERKRAEASLRASEEKYRTLFEEMDEGFALCEMIRDADGKPIDYRYLEVNRALGRQSGLTADAIVGKRATEAFPNLDPWLIRTYGQVVDMQKSIEAERFYPHVNLWFRLNAFPREGDRFAVVFTNITESKRAEATLRESEERYRTLFETVDQGYLLGEVILDENDKAIDIRFLQANPAALRLAGRDFTGQRMREIDPYYEEYWYGTYGHVVRTGEPVRAEHYAEPHGRWFDFHLSRVGGPESRCVASVFEDITERKRREQQQEFLLRFSDALRREPSADAVADRAIRMLIEHLQLDRSYIVSYRLEDDRADLVHQVGNDTVRPLPEVFILSDYPAAFRATLDQTLVIEDEWERQGLSEAERRNSGRLGMRAMVAATVRKGENRPLWSMVAINSRPRRWTRDEIVLIEEVTERAWAAVERARAENALRSSEGRLQSIANLVPDLLWESEPDGSTNWYNRRWLDYTGQSFEEATGWKWIEAIHPDDREASARRYREAVENGVMLRQEHRIRRYDGQYRWFIVNTFVFRNPSGQVIKIYGAATDIHDQRVALDTIRRSEERLRIVIEAAELGTWDWNLETGLVLWNERHFHLLGLTPRPGLVLADEFFNRVHEEDREQLRRMLEEALASDHTFEAQFRVRWPNGQICWMEGYGRVVEEQDGRPIRMSGVMSDITSRKEAMEALQESEARIRALADAVPQVMWTNDATGEAVYFNERWFEYTGLTYERSAGPGWQAVVHPDDAPASVEKWQQALARGTVFDTEYRLRRHDGVYRWFIGRNVPFKDTQGNVNRWFGTATDIDDLKQAEMALARGKDELEERVVERTQELMERTEQLAEMNQLRQELLRQVVTAQEQERARIARDLHDDTGQLISALLLGLANLRQLPSLTSDEAVRRRFDQLAELADQVAQKSHRLSFTLRPTTLDDIGLLGALQNYTDAWSGWSGIPVEIETIGMEDPEGGIIRLPREIETTIYRVTQEALTNALKHAIPGGATRVSVLVQRRGTEVLTVVEDDGPGFDVDAVLNLPAGKRRLGIFGMEERARLAGGRLTVESEPGAGASIYLRLPLPA